MSEPRKQRSRPWRRPVEWALDQSFWRDVTSQTLGTLFAAGLGFLWGRAAGLFSHIPWSTILKIYAYGAGTMAVFILVGVLVYQHSRDTIKLTGGAAYIDPFGNLWRIRTESDEPQGPDEADEKEQDKRENSPDAE